MDLQLQSGFGFAGHIEGSMTPRDISQLQEIKSNSDVFWMKQALLWAMDHAGIASPNPTVGCVFVREGQLIAGGATEKFGGLHGERVASQRVADKSHLEGSTCYVTLEPCSHQGKQPPCVDVLIQGKIKRCVIGISDPYHEVNGGGIKALRDAGIEVSLGVLENELLAWHFPFLFEQFFQRPLIVAKWAQTSDGFLADDQGKSKWITGEMARKHTHFLRQRYDGIMVGAGTVVSDFPRLNVRGLGLAATRNPIKIIADRSGDLLNLDEDDQLKLKKTLLTGEATIYCGPSIDGSWLSSVSNLHHFSIVTMDREFFKRLSDFCESKGLRKLQSIMVEGGSALLSALISHNLIDAYHMFQRPSFLGGHIHRIKRQIRRSSYEMEDKLDLHLLAVNSMGQDVLIDAIDPDVFETFAKSYLAAKI